MNKKRQIRAVGMMSGGLDSMLAMKIIMAQGIHVTALHFRTGFSYIDLNQAVGSKEINTIDAQRAAELLDVPLAIIDVADPYISIVLHPRFGYGSGMNPCVDCRIFLLRQAKAWMEQHGYHFVFTGEVVGQRPMSQHKPTLRTVARESGLEGYLLRPLSAKLLQPTVPEQRGWVDREKLYAISGRGRKKQIALAKQFGITEYAQPSGGCCYLIQKVYARRLRDFLAREGPEALDNVQAQLLAVARHLRLPSGRKVIVGRDERENAYLASSAVKGPRLLTLDHPGPTTLMPGQPSREEIEQAARITASYCDGKDEPAVRVAVHRPEAPVEVISVAPMPREAVHQLMV